MKINVRMLCLLGGLAGISFPLQAQEEAAPGWGDRARSAVGRYMDPASTTSFMGGAEELARGLREALAVSAERALIDLGRAGGFSESERFRIPLPPSVENFRQPLTRIGQEQRLDDFQAAMNRAAEEGVAAAPSIVRRAIENLTLDNLTQLWKGGDDAITRFLEEQSRAELAERMRPLISEATNATGATRTYKDIEAALSKGGGIFSRVRSLFGREAAPAFDLDEYVNKQALNALFTAMAGEEKALREEPAARTTDLLKRLFFDG